MSNYGTCGPEFGVKEETSSKDGKIDLPCTCTKKGGLSTVLTSTHLKAGLVSGSHVKGARTLHSITQL